MSILPTHYTPTVAMSIGTVLTAGILAVSSAVSAVTMTTPNAAAQALSSNVEHVGSMLSSINTAQPSLSEVNARDTWSYLRGYGLNDVQIAGVLGNFAVESSIDPTAVETVLDEPHQIGATKQALWDQGFSASALHSVGQSQYATTYSAINTVGIGLGQWTNERNTLLMDYAALHGRDWYDLHTQLDFMVTADDAYRVNALSQIDSSSVSAAVQYFMYYWEGISNGTDPQRTINAELYYWLMGNAWTINPEYFEYGVENGV